MIGGFSRSSLSSYEKVPLGELRGRGFEDSREMLRNYKDKEMKVWERSKLYNSRIQEATDLNG